MLALLLGANAALPFSTARAADFPFNFRAQTQARAQSKDLLQAAFSAHESGDSARALGLLDQAERLRPDQPDAANLRGAILLKRGDYPRAEAAFARAVALDPELWAARFNLAEVPFRQKNYVRARQLFDRLVTQTDRYKAASQWELAQYKSLLCSVLMGDEPGAQKRLAKLPTAPAGAGATASPASFYGRAALAFARKDAAAANQSLAAAQAACKPGANAIYLRSLEAAGWVTSPVLPSTVPLTGLAAARAGSAPAPAPAPSRQPVISNLPITEPELPGAASGTGVAPSALTGDDGRARTITTPRVDGQSPEPAPRPMPAEEAPAQPELGAKPGTLPSPPPSESKS